jgi:pimeloyl-ACP methyl ester carboxylesterase
MRFFLTLLVAVLASFLLGISAVAASSSSLSRGPSPNPSYTVFLQRAEHSEKMSPVWKQRVLINSAFALDDSAPALVYLGPAGPIDPESLHGYITTLARTYRAHIVAPEHRFYGESYPERRLVMSALKSHTVENAIEDVATFIRDFSLNGKKLRNVLLVGSDFGATLAAWLRVRYPDLTVGAIAASPIVNPVSPAFTNFYLSLGRAITAAQGGKTQCAEAVANDVSFLISTVEDYRDDRPARTRVYEEYKLCSPVPGYDESLTSQEALYITVVDAVATAVQAGRTAKMCEIITADPEASAGSRLGRYIKHLSVDAQRSCFRSSYPDYLASRNLTGDFDNKDGLRQNLWLACNELGTFAAGNTNTAKYPAFFKHVCADLFRIEDSFGRAASRIAELKQEFGGLKYAGQKVVFANSKFNAYASDELTVFESLPSQDVLAVTSTGALLSTDDRGSLPHDRAIVSAQVDKWLTRPSAVSRQQNATGIRQQNCTAQNSTGIVSDALLRSLKLFSQQNATAVRPTVSASLLRSLKLFN